MSNTVSNKPRRLIFAKQSANETENVYQQSTIETRNTNNPHSSRRLYNHSSHYNPSLYSNHENGSHSTSYDSKVMIHSRQAQILIQSDNLRIEVPIEIELPSHYSQSQYTSPQVRNNERELSNSQIPSNLLSPISQQNQGLNQQRRQSTGSPYNITKYGTIVQNDGYQIVNNGQSIGIKSKSSERVTSSPTQLNSGITGVNGTNGFSGVTGISGFNGIRQESKNFSQHTPIYQPKQIMIENYPETQQYDPNSQEPSDSYHPVTVLPSFNNHTIVPVKKPSLKFINESLGSKSNASLATKIPSIRMISNYDHSLQMEPIASFSNNNLENPNRIQTPNISFDSNVSHPYIITHGAQSHPNTLQLPNHHYNLPVSSLPQSNTVQQSGCSHPQTTIPKYRPKLTINSQLNSLSVMPSLNQENIKKDLIIQISMQNCARLLNNQQKLLRVISVMENKFNIRANNQRRQQQTQTQELIGSLFTKMDNKLTQVQSKTNSTLVSLIQLAQKQKSSNVSMQIVNQFNDRLNILFNTLNDIKTTYGSMEDKVKYFEKAIVELEKSYQAIPQTNRQIGNYSNSGEKQRRLQGSHQYHNYNNSQNNNQNIHNSPYQSQKSQRIAQINGQKYIQNSNNRVTDNLLSPNSYVPNHQSSTTAQETFNMEFDKVFGGQIQNQTKVNETFKAYPSKPQSLLPIQLNNFDLTIDSFDQFLKGNLIEWGSPNPTSFSNDHRVSRNDPSVSMNDPSASRSGQGFVKSNNCYGNLKLNTEGILPLRNLSVQPIMSHNQPNEQFKLTISPQTIQKGRAETYRQWIDCDNQQFTNNLSVPSQMVRSQHQFQVNLQRTQAQYGSPQRVRNQQINNIPQNSHKKRHIATLQDQVSQNDYIIVDHNQSHVKSYSQVQNNIHFKSKSAKITQKNHNKPSYRIESPRNRSEKRPSHQYHAYQQNKSYLSYNSPSMEMIPQNSHALPLFLQEVKSPITYQTSTLWNQQHPSRLNSNSMFMRSSVNYNGQSVLGSSHSGTGLRPKNETLFDTFGKKKDLNRER